MHTQADNEDKIVISILDKEYPVEGTINENEAQEIANYVDEKLRMLKETSPMVPQARLAILACLNIAQELFEFKKRYAKELGGFEQRLDTIISEIENIVQ